MRSLLERANGIKYKHIYTGEWSAEIRSVNSQNKILLFRDMDNAIDLSKCEIYFGGQDSLTLIHKYGVSAERTYMGTYSIYQSDGSGTITSGNGGNCSITVNEGRITIDLGSAPSSYGPETAITTNASIPVVVIEYD